MVLNLGKTIVAAVLSASSNAPRMNKAFEKIASKSAWLIPFNDILLLSLNEVATDSFPWHLTTNSWIVLLGRTLPTNGVSRKKKPGLQEVRSAVETTGRRIAMNNRITSCAILKLREKNSRSLVSLFNPCGDTREPNGLNVFIFQIQPTTETGII